MINMAPRNAPAMTAKKPDSEKAPAESEPPPNNITSATPRLAPELIPKIEGSASGLLKAVCSISPETAKAAPHSKAVIHCGIRDSSTINRQLSFSTSLPSRISPIASRGICIDPMTRLQKRSTRISIPINKPCFQPVDNVRVPFMA